jgi:hypothetical protein
MEVKMKLYRIFIHGVNVNNKDYPAISDFSPSDIGDDNIYLYAFTNKKKIAKKFMESRIHDLFYVTTSNISDDDYNDICDKYGDYELSYHEYKYQTFQGNKSVSKNLKILSTEKEFDLVFYDAPVILSKIGRKLMDVMDKIQFNLLNDTLYNVLTNTIPSRDIIEWMYEIEDAPFGVYEINTVNLYFHEFGNTYNIERICDAYETI